MVKMSVKSAIGTSALAWTSSTGALVVFAAAFSQSPNCCAFSAPLSAKTNPPFLKPPLLMVITCVVAAAPACAPGIVGRRKSTPSPGASTKREPKNKKNCTISAPTTRNIQSKLRGGGRRREARSSGRVIMGLPA
jgi:hypothetical protein